MARPSRNHSLTELISDRDETDSGEVSDWYDDDDTCSESGSEFSVFTEEEELDGRFWSENDESEEASQFSDLSDENTFEFSDDEEEEFSDLDSAPPERFENQGKRVSFQIPK